MLNLLADFSLRVLESSLASVEQRVDQLVNRVEVEDDDDNDDDVFG